MEAGPPRVWLHGSPLSLPALAQGLRSRGGVENCVFLALDVCTALLRCELPREPTRADPSTDLDYSLSGRSTVLYVLL